MSFLLGIDTGGTFTDLIAYDVVTGRISQHKTLTDYASVVDGMLRCIADASVALEDTDRVVHGTTHVINAYLQRRGARTALVTTRGFRDLLEIGRANRPIAFQLRLGKQEALVPRHLRFEVTQRTSATGDTLCEVSVADLEAVAQRAMADGIEALAVSFLNAYANPAHERLAADWLRARLPGVYVTAATDLSMEWFEYERTATAVANAFVGPGIRVYLDGVRAGLAKQRFRGSLKLMASNGGTLTIDRAIDEPIALVESGPIGGCIGAAAFSRALGLDRMIAFDMGGTTAKCALIDAGHFDVQSTYYVGGYERGFPIRAAVLDIVEVGLGGGSIASVDELGRLRVGPDSAGSEPGPAAFDRGGAVPTVTDANLVLGRISRDGFLTNGLRLNETAAREALRRQVATALGMDAADQDDRVAAGVIEVATTVMAGAIKEITVERGRDATDYVLFAFGGGGPLHASLLARELHIRTIIVPPRPGSFSACGMLMAELREDGQRTFFRALEDASLVDAAGLFAEMQLEAERALREQGAKELALVERRLEMRFRGQRQSIAVMFDPGMSAHELGRRFEAVYEERFGHRGPGSMVEIVALRLTASSPAHALSPAQVGIQRVGAQSPSVRIRDVYFLEAQTRLPTAVYRREELPTGFSCRGPAVIEEYGATTVIGPGDCLRVGSLSELHISRED
ncbi:MAG: hydantoinase/oxoprolinase family protein [Burkholderiales bacterium]|nr:hydantoinase/oxoprolinase family protein [Burkholderiales bacterium]